MNWVLGGPWQRREVVWPGVRIAIGPLGILVAWYGASDTLDWTEQSWWMAIGAIALIISLTGVAGVIKVGLRNLRRLERLMLGTARAQFAGAAAAIRSDARSAAQSTAQSEAALVTVSGTTLFHRADCLLVTGKTVSGVHREAALAGRLETCGMCEP